MWQEFLGSAPPKAQEFWSVASATHAAECAPTHRPEEKVLTIASQSWYAVRYLFEDARDLYIFRRRRQ